MSIDFSAPRMPVEPLLGSAGVIAVWQSASSAGEWRPQVTARLCGIAAAGANYAHESIPVFTAILPRLLDFCTSPNDILADFALELLAKLRGVFHVA
jgi:hypothetical protein